MAEPYPPEQEQELPPPGTRWGSGAQSVLPFLTKSLQSRPAAAATESRDARPSEQLGGDGWGQRPSA